jgi:hypothetical protein
MKVRFKPLHGQDSVVVPDVLDANGEPVYFSLEEPERDLSDAEAAIVLSNPNFVDASGKNPLRVDADPTPESAPEPEPTPAPFFAPAHDANHSEV